MNIFYLHSNATEAPRYLYNKHCVKMILETAQMLSTAHHHYAEELNYDNSYIPYKKAYYNHPSTQWARLNSTTYRWLWNYFVSINIEYYQRYGKVHKSWIKCKDILHLEPIGIPLGEFVQPPQCMPDKYKTDCSIQAYWNYYINAKKHIPNKNEKQLTDIPYDTIN